ncbi:uncharacterized protein BDW43DRAFT_81422 [Aspergillus alliaceus]|uniref:uncharacterized protein n=1 Tax=Petromyces alliaceus TaxID=209559 RepID=UPI0012A70D81|nr:uncharacterized protein BDW43DRAFT_81422 [Aspergillus alliaceus]KAB8233561.1 hypothetical protein BDW43DRAFT_81422 [Aspergillus alliaceus]
MGRTNQSDHPMYQDPFEFGILQSPGLHTLAFEYTFEVMGNLIESLVKLDEIFPLSVLTMSPTLNHLIVQLNSVFSSSRNISNLKREWRRFVAALEPHPSQVTHIESLSFPALSSDPVEYILLKFSEVLDFSHIRCLDIHMYSNPNTLAEVALLLTSLNQLSITDDPQWRFYPDPTADNHEMIWAIQVF